MKKDNVSWYLPFEPQSRRFRYGIKKKTTRKNRRKDRKKEDKKVIWEK
jgi:hypothetical protein